jgi:hypothetical protein
MSLPSVIMDFFSTIQLTNLMGILLYWVPMSLCVFGYTVRTGRNYSKDKKELAECIQKPNAYYHPTDTLGDIIGRAVVSIIPVANLWAALFDVAPVMFSRLFRFFGKVFNQPLVPDSRKGLRP